MKKLLVSIFILFSLIASGQSKVGGVVVDESGEPVAFANVIFKNSTEGTTTDDNGNFYMESNTTYEILTVSFMGFETKEVELTSKVNYNMKIELLESNEQLDEVIVFGGKQSKKNNPAIDIPTIQH